MISRPDLGRNRSDTVGFGNPSQFFKHKGFYVLLIVIELTLLYLLVQSQNFGQWDKVEEGLLAFRRKLQSCEW
ncbi:uncharacterized protein PHALS_11521 [Plasmopara halstedii]|uniref:Uncharacterized protein n=1 Tax=Plasmopara halstedii TaxID=4781 RepID=A0A0N7L3E5_PLAHL|nr:uncharacterized protein PHALS_11521 [Plasmopara halstedii]CEG35651.1 hypothetical protein PHALS_11521 [Plasmopara halstedii]|eukprot:XP_024572020.1 hypothetical protein PHALS_11521 [Plasmopara halstedii]